MPSWLHRVFIMVVPLVPKPATQVARAVEPPPPPSTRIGQDGRASVASNLLDVSSDEAMRVFGLMQSAQVVKPGA